MWGVTLRSGYYLGVGFANQCNQHRALPVENVSWVEVLL
jgi:hypothetical protein